MRPERPFVVERRAIAARRLAAHPEDLGELRLVIATMRDVPPGATDSFADMFHLLRRLAGRLDRIAGRMEVVEAKPARSARTRLPGHLGTDHAAIVAGVFDASPRPARERTRTVVSRAGKRVRVVERAAGQLELRL